MARRLLALSILTVSLFGAGGCPENPIEPDGGPTVQTWVIYGVTPGTQRGTRGATLRYQVRVQDKAILNAGVEFDVQSAPSGLTATVSPNRISETGRDTEVVVEIPAHVPLGEYRLTVRARLTVAGQSAATWHEQFVTVEVVTGESGFTLICAPAEFTLPAGAGQTLVCRRLRDPGFSAAIDLSFGPFPEFLTINPRTARLEPNDSGFAFVVSRSPQIIPPPAFSLRAIARGGGLERDFTVRILMPSAALGR